MRALKRRLSDVVFRQMRADARAAREDTWGRLLTPARPAQTPTPALRTSHFPDPPPTTLRHQTRPVLQVEPGALHRHRTTAAVKRLRLTAARTGAHWQAGNDAFLTEGSHESAFATPAQITPIRAYGPWLSSCTSRRAKRRMWHPSQGFPAATDTGGLLAAQPLARCAGR